MLAKTHNRTRTLRAIKDAFMVHKTAKNAKPLDEVTELTILKRMLKQRNESAAQYLAVGRNDLWEIEVAEAKIISEFIPKEPTREEVEQVVLTIATNNGWYTTTDGISIPKKSMGLVVKQVKELLPAADGKLVSDIVKLYV